MKTKHTCILLASTALFFSCQEKDTTNNEPATNNGAPSALLMAVIDAEVTGKPVSIHALKATAKAGDNVIISGEVMGNKDPFVEGRSAFILGDPEILTPCNKRSGDDCKTPWDACCDTKSDKKRATATIQITDKDGRVLKEGIEGVGGIEKLSSLTISGTVAESSSEDLLIINASAIDVVK